MTKEEYNDIPVMYCSSCLSLLVEEDELIGDYCHQCGCTEIKETHIEDWEKLYIQKYNKKF